MLTEIELPEIKSKASEPSAKDQVLRKIEAHQFTALLNDFFQNNKEACDLLRKPELLPIWEKILTARRLYRHRLSQVSPHAPDQRLPFAILVGLQCNAEARRVYHKIGDIDECKKWILRGAASYDFWCQREMTLQDISFIHTAIEERRVLPENFIDEAVQHALKIAQYHYSFGFVLLAETAWKIAEYYSAQIDFECSAQDSLANRMSDVNQNILQRNKWYSFAVMVINVAVNIWPHCREISMNCCFHPDPAQQQESFQAEESRMRKKKSEFEKILINSDLRLFSQPAIALGKQIADQIQQDGECRLDVT